MAFGTTLTVTIAAVAKVLNRINQDSYSSEWSLLETDRSYVMFLRHSKRKDSTGREFHRHNAELTITVYATPTTPEYVRKYYSVADFPKETLIATAKDEFTGTLTYMGGGAVTAGLLEWMS